jgi:hypothetical protein
MNDPAKQSDEAHTSGVLPVVTWLAIQLLALLLAASNTPLWARPASPIESLALPIMLAFQATAAVLLFPWLFPDPTALLRVAGSAILFDQLSGMLATRTSADIVAGSIGVTAWIVALWLWNSVCTSDHAKLIAVAALSTASIGFLGGVYASAEFGEGRIALTSSLIWGILWTNLIAACIARIARRILAPTYPQVHV